MDTTDPDIIFDENGYCNHCTSYLNKIKQQTYNGEASDKELLQLVNRMKKAGKNRKYDCITGVSGGVDSTYVVYLLKKLGLRVLAVHMDNGWDTEESVKNIRKIIKNIGVDYVSDVLDWEAFKVVQLAFLKASVPEVETPTDIAIPAVLHKIAAKYGIKYIISGGNYASEGILPKIWQYNAKDMKYFRTIVKRYAPKNFYKFPTFGFLTEMYYKFLKGIRIIYILNYVNYKKDETKELLKKDLDWMDYGGKHHESRITSFVQSYLMPVKFNIDYRKATFSSMICENQMERDEAVRLLKELPYNENTIESDKDYIAKKFDVSRSEFDKILDKPAKYYRDYPNEERRLEFIYNTYRKLFPKKRL
jgi:N-acetyl sugar amidotransferase